MNDLRRRLDELKAVAPRGRHRPARRAAARPVHLSEAIGGGEQRRAGTPFWQLETTFTQTCDRFDLALPPRITALQTQPPSRHIAHADPARSLVIDIETGGFAGTEVFLIGWVLLDRRPLTVVQWLARDYPEERGILRALAEIAPHRDTWITFNGKSFDEPFLRDRAAVHRVRLTPPTVHIDLLHYARRRWSDQLPNCKLQTLEQHVLGWQRVGDVPSSDIPDLFHHFIRTHNAAPIRPVLEHNQLDLISCTELLVQLL